MASYTIVEEADETIAVYNERGQQEEDFATRQEAEVWIDYWHRDEMASPIIQARAREKFRPLIEALGAEAAAEFNLEVSDTKLDVRWAIEELLDEIAPE